MYRLSFTLRTGERREHYCNSQEEAAAMWHNLVSEPTVARVCVHERHMVRVKEDDKWVDADAWRLMTWASDGEAVSGDVVD